MDVSDFARLQEKLAKLRQRERAASEARKLRGAESDALIAALVVEIDETILPRRLTLSTGETVFHLAVANKRLQALLSPVPGIPGAEGLADKALADVEDPGLQALREVLVQAFSAGDPVEVKTERLTSKFGSDIGVPSNLLARAWNVAKGTEERLEPKDILTKYLKNISKSGVAWLRIEGEDVTDQNGDAAAVALLGEQAAVFLDGYFSKFDTLFPEESLACGTVISPGGDAGLAMIFVEIGDVSAFVAVDPGKTTELAAAWLGLVAE